MQFVADTALSCTGVTSGLFGSQWHAAAVAESAAMKQLLQDFRAPQSAIAAAAAIAGTAAEALTGWLCVLNALGKGQQEMAVAAA